jgi:hypothetical protein
MRKYWVIGLLCCLLWTTGAWSQQPVRPKLFKSTDTGAETLSGTAGELIRAWDTTLIINRQFTAISGGSFVDNSAEARLEGGTAFKLFQGPTVNNDEAYFGLQQTFERLIFNFGTAGVEDSAITLTWEYWNGSAWTSFSPTDGTTKFTAHGTVSWTISALTGWATTSVNGKNVYWVRVRFTAGSWTTNPLVNHVTILGWTKAFSDTNQAVYRQGAGSGFFLETNDSAPGAGGAKEARIRGWETMPTWVSYGDNTGTGPFPTAAQYTNGMFTRKSASADATTRVWYLWADHQTFYWMPFTGDSANTAYPMGFGAIFSYVVNDSYGTAIWGSTTENSSGGTQAFSQCQTALNSLTTSAYLARNIGSSPAGSIALGQHTDNAKLNNTAGNCGTDSANAMAFPNGADGNVYAERVFVHEATNQVRGFLRGVLVFLHPSSNLTDGNTYSGATLGSWNGRSYIGVKSLRHSGSAPGAILLFETSNTVDTN